MGCVIAEENCYSVFGAAARRVDYFSESGVHYQLYQLIDCDTDAQTVSRLWCWALFVNVCSDDINIWICWVDLGKAVMGGPYSSVSRRSTLEKAAELPSERKLFSLLEQSCGFSSLWLELKDQLFLPVQPAVSKTADHRHPSAFLFLRSSGFGMAPSLQLSWISSLGHFGLHIISYDKATL